MNLDKIRRKRICFNSTQRILRRSFSLQGEVYSTPANPSVTICSIRVTLIQHTCKALRGRKIIKAGAYQHWIDIYCVVCGGQEMIEETQMQSMEVLSRLISSLCIEPKVDSNSENSFSGKKDFLILVCFRWFSLYILFKEKTWQSHRIHFEEFSNSFYFSSRIKYCKGERNMSILCVWLV